MTRHPAMMLLLTALVGHVASVRSVVDLQVVAEEAQQKAAENANVNATEKVENTHEHTCTRIGGASLRESHRWRSHECECPENTVINGDSQDCKDAASSYTRTFDDESELGKDGSCKCEHKRGCGLIWYEVDDVIPANAKAKDLPPALEVGTRDNINTGIADLDKEYYGIWWMRDNPVPEELATMAGATSRYTGVNPTKEDIQWPVDISVPNAMHNRWAWADNFQANWVIMPQYYWSEASATFHMYNTTNGEIPTGLKTMPGVWVEKWHLDKINDDTWLRTTTFQKGSLFSKNEYTLTRIVNEDGSATKYFPAFKEHMIKNMSDSPLQVWDSDNPCKRKCMHRGNDCQYCHQCCTGGSDGGPTWNCRHR